MKKLLKILGVAILLVVGLVFGAKVAWDAPRPEATPGPEGDALARKLEAAVNAEAWAATGAVRWDFAGRNKHLWDRTRNLDRVSWGDTVALVDLGKQQGRAWRDGEELTGEKAEKAVAHAYGAWVNDSFWLNPAVKTFDDGVTRAATKLEDGHDGLLVAYSSGGLTPGDAYLWELDETGLPTAWQMWVSVIPVGGVRATWADWQTLATGARIATTHEFGPTKLKISELAGAATLAELESPDPFGPLSP